MTLFDPEEYRSGPSPIERQRAEVPEAPTITLGVGRWILLGRRNVRASAHLLAHSWGTEGSVKTECGLKGAPLTFPPGAEALACYKCLAAVDDPANGWGVA